MKAIRKSDGKEIDVRLYNGEEYIETEATGSFGARVYTADALILEEPFDWSAFRREAAKDILCALVGNKDYLKVIGRIEPETMLAIALADELIKQLKYETN